MGRGVVGRDVLFYIISSYLETGGAACGGHRTHTTGKGDSGHSRSSTVRKQDPPSQAQGSWSRSSNTEPQSPYPNPSPLSQRSLSHQTSASQDTQPRAPYRRDYRLKTGQGSEILWSRILPPDRVLSSSSSRWLCLVSLRAKQKASKAWGPLLGSKLRSSTFWPKLPVLAYENKTRRHLYSPSWNLISPGELCANIIIRLKDSFSQKETDV